MASLADRCRVRRGADHVRHRTSDRPVCRQHPPARAAARRNRRPLGWPLAGMGHGVAAAGLQFRVPPEVTGEDPFWQFKKRAARQPGTEDQPEYRDIEIPRNSPTGFVCAFFATVMGFALIWHIWWMVAVGLIGAFATFVVFAWRDHDEDTIPADEVARIDRNNRAQRYGMLSKQAAE